MLDGARVFGTIELSLGILYNSACDSPVVPSPLVKPAPRIQARFTFGSLLMAMVYPGGYSMNKLLILAVAALPLAFAAPAPKTTTQMKTHTAAVTKAKAIKSSKLKAGKVYKVSKAQKVGKAKAGKVYKAKRVSTKKTGR